MAVTAYAALELAEKVRLYGGTATPVDLWRAADDESGGSDTRRRELYRHAMVHAGYLVDGDGRRHARCPLCRRDLAP